MILIRGLPGSGKSTLANGFTCDWSWRHFEADMFFVDENGEYNFNSSKIKFAHEWCKEQTRMALVHGLNVVVSNTFTTKWELSPYFDIAKSFDITPTVILAQNNYKSVHNVPEETLIKMRDRFEYDISSLFGE